MFYPVPYRPVSGAAGVCEVDPRVVKLLQDVLHLVNLVRGNRHNDSVDPGNSVTENEQDKEEWSRV